MSFFISITLSLLSAVVFTLSVPNEFLFFGSSILGLVSLIPLYLSFYTCKNRKQTAVCFGLWVAFVHLLSSFWLGFFRDFAIFTLGVSSIAYFILSLCFGPAFYEVVRLKNTSLKPLAFAVVWVFWEWFKSTGFLAYPWGTIAMSTYNAHWLKQIADITGVWGIGFVMALFSSSLAEVLKNIVKSLGDFSKPFSLNTTVKSKKNLILSYKSELNIVALCLVIFVVCAGYSFYRINEKRVPVDTLKAAIIQANGNSWETSFEDQLEKAIALTESLLENSQKPDIILWNEGSLYYSFPLNPLYYFVTPKSYTFAEFLAKNKIPLLAGTATPFYSDNENEDFSFFGNSVCLLSPESEILDVYSKIHLVPFAEYMPLVDKAWVRKVFSSLVGFSSAYIPGREYKLISLTKQDGKTVNFSSPICFEDAFPSLCATLHNLGSELIVNLTDDSWSNTKSAEYQHFVVSSFRTIELRTTMIRSTNSGYTCVVSPLGNVILDLPLFTSAGLYADVPIYPYQTTFYARYKDWLPILCYALIILFTVYSFFIGKMSKPEPLLKTSFIEVKI